MAPFIPPPNPKRRPPSPPDGQDRSRRTAQLMLGNFRGVFRQFPELRHGDHAYNSLPPVTPAQKHAGHVPSPPATATPARLEPSPPRLGNLAKLGLLASGYDQSLNVAYPSQDSYTGHDCDRLNTTIGGPRSQSPWGSRCLPTDRIDRDSSLTAVEEDQLLDTDIVSCDDLDVVSRVTTPATSPDLALSDIRVKTVANLGSLRTQAIFKREQGFPISSGLYEQLHSLSDEPIDIEAILGPSLVPVPRCKALNNFGISYNNNRPTIEPYRRVDKETQLQRVSSHLSRLDLDQPAQGQEPHVAQPLHVFVDMSNIVISFYDHMKKSRNLNRNEHVQGAQAPFFFEALAMILERNRACAKRVLVGSMGSGRIWEDYMNDAESLGYKTQILQRVRGAKPLRVLANASPNCYSSNAARANAYVNPNAYREQGVDEILQLHMMESVVDTPMAVDKNGELLSPGTMVLATGDGAPADFSDGFFAQVMRALKHGWYVEVVGFSNNMNRVWVEQPIPEEWRPRFRKIALDPFAEELLVSFSR